MMCLGCGVDFSPSERQLRRLRTEPAARIFCTHRCSNRPSNHRYVCHNRGRLNGPGLGRQEQNIKAFFWCVRGPDRKIYKFRSLAQFVRDNPQLFPSGTAVKPPDRRRQNTAACISQGPSLAERGIGRLFSRRYQVGSWHGWLALWKKDPLGNIVWLPPQRVGTAHA